MCPGHLVERRYAPRQQAPETLCPMTLGPGDKMPQWTTSSGGRFALVDSMPQKTLCPRDTMPRDTKLRRHYALVANMP